jgi:hypothetical protein
MHFRLVFLKLRFTTVRQVVHGGFRRKSIGKIVSYSERMKNTPTRLPNLPLLAHVQQKVGELVLPTTSCPSIIILEHALN